MRISDWSSDVCSSDLQCVQPRPHVPQGDDHGRPSPRSGSLARAGDQEEWNLARGWLGRGVASLRENRSPGHQAIWQPGVGGLHRQHDREELRSGALRRLFLPKAEGGWNLWLFHRRSEEHTSELQSLMRISYAVFCLKNYITRCISY